MALVAVTVPFVLPLIVLRSAAATVPASTVATKFVSRLILLSSLACSSATTAAIFAAVPVNPATLVAVIWPDVFASIEITSDAATVPVVNVTS